MSLCPSLCSDWNSSITVGWIVMKRGYDIRVSSAWSDMWSSEWELCFNVQLKIRPFLMFGKNHNSTAVRCHFHSEFTNTLCHQGFIFDSDIKGTSWSASGFQGVVDLWPPVFKLNVMKLWLILNKAPSCFLPPFFSSYTPLKNILNSPSLK